MDELFNYDTNPPAIYQQYAPPVTSTFIPQQISGDVTIITTINGGGGGQATGPAITLGSNWSGVNFVANQGNVNIEITNAANARTALGAAASGINTDITQLNGASQVDVSGHYEVDGVQVVQEQGAAVADPVGGGVIDVECRAQLIELLNRLRAHGLIST